MAQRSDTRDLSARWQSMRWWITWETRSLLNYQGSFFSAAHMSLEWASEVPDPKESETNAGFTSGKMTAHSIEPPSSRITRQIINPKRMSNYRHCSLPMDREDKACSQKKGLTGLSCWKFPNPA